MFDDELDVCIFQPPGIVGVLFLLTPGQKRKSDKKENLAF